MNEHQLGRLLRRWVLLTAPLPLAVLGAACGGAMTGHDDDGEAGASARAGSETGGGRTATAGNGSGGSNAGNGGTFTSGGTLSSAGSGGTPVDCQSKTNGQNTCSPWDVVVPWTCLGPTSAAPGGPLPPETCKNICSMTLGCTSSAATENTVTVHCQPGCVVGRRPAGLGEPGTCDTRSAGRYFADIAHLEAASVTAFRVLRDELRANGAPKKLVRAAARAARDEIRHTRATGALARRFGAAPRQPQVDAVAPRSLEAIALENAVEGCVRETYGALLATHQARHAADPVVRSAMLRIARDETRHAALSWQVARWLDARLDARAKQNVSTARRVAASELIDALANEAEPSFAALAGLPSAAHAQQLATEMQRSLWS